MKSFQYPTPGDVVLLERLRPDEIFPENHFGYLGIATKERPDILTVDFTDGFVAIFGKPRSLVSVSGSWRIIDNLGPLEDSAFIEAVKTPAVPEGYIVKWSRGGETPTQSSGIYDNLEEAIEGARQQGIYQPTFAYYVEGTQSKKVYWKSELDSLNPRVPAEPDGYVVECSRGAERSVPTGSPYTDLSAAISFASERAKMYKGWWYTVRGRTTDKIYWESRQSEKPVQENVIAPGIPDVVLVQQRITNLAERIAKLEGELSEIKKMSPPAQKHELPTPQQLQQSREALAVEHYGQAIVSDLKNAAEILSNIATRIDEWEDRVLNTTLVRDEEDLADARSAFDNVGQCAAEIEDAAEEMANQINILNIKPQSRTIPQPQRDAGLYKQASKALQKLRDDEKGYRYHTWPLTRFGESYIINETALEHRKGNRQDQELEVARLQSIGGGYTMLYDWFSKTIVALFHNGEEIK